jgi:hypothetical protein
MMDQRIIQWIENKYQGISDELSERARRRWAAVESVSLGRGGISVTVHPKIEEGGAAAQIAFL